MRRVAVPLVVLLLLLPGAGAAAFDGRDAAVASLRTSQAHDGGWGSRTATDWVVLGLAAAGEDPRAWGVEAHLLANPPEATSFLAWARSTLALACGGWDPRSFHGANYALVVELGFLGTQFGNPSWVHDDAWSMLALRAADVPADDARLRLAGDHVLRGQHASGGWSWSFGGAPDADDTAAVLMALAATGHPGREPAVDRAHAWLRATQNPDGGWGLLPGASSNLLSTAWVTMALLAAGEDVDAAWDAPGGAGPLDLLASLQGADGAFRYAPGSGQAGAALIGTALPPLLGKTYVCE